MFERLTYNDKPLSDFQTFYDGARLFDTPSRDVEFFVIPGRNGQLSISNHRYDNVLIEVPCFIKENFKSNFAELINFLSHDDEYHRLETSQEADVFRMAKFVEGIEPNTGVYNRYGNFVLVFNCMPQKWLKEGERPIKMSATDILFNPTYQTAKPLIEVQGTGSITVGNNTLTLARNSGKTIIDCELKDAYEGTINRNGDLTIANRFIELVKGENEVKYTGFTNVEITPRWWRV